MFLENPKRSGGGDIEKFEFDSKKKIIMIEYSSHQIKENVLMKKNFNFSNYAFTANEPFSSLVFQRDCKTLILRNFRCNEDKMYAQLFAENLVLPDNEENDVLRIEVSRFVIFIKPFPWGSQEKNPKY